MHEDDTRLAAAVRMPNEMAIRNAIYVARLNRSQISAKFLKT